MLTIPLLKATDIEEKYNELKMNGLKTELDNYQWTNKEHVMCDIHTSLYLGHDNSHLFLLFEVQEPILRATHSEHFSDVFEDSCVEFFYRECGSLDYTNIEINPKGATLIGYGKDRYNRIYPPVDVIDSLGINTTYDEKLPYNGSWSVYYHIPLGSIEKDRVFFANAYKCGNLTPYPHFITLFHIDTQSPDFHQSSYFQPFVVE